MNIINYILLPLALICEKCSRIEFEYYNHESQRQKDKDIRFYKAMYVRLLITDSGKRFDWRDVLWRTKHKKAQRYSKSFIIEDSKT